VLSVSLKSNDQSAFPKSDGNLFEWAGTIEGPAETVNIVHSLV